MISKRTSLFAVIVKWTIVFCVDEQRKTEFGSSIGFTLDDSPSVINKDK